MNSRDGAVPDSTEQSIERQLRERGLNAPRLTPELVENAIVREQYHVFPGTTMTVCCLTLVNGYCVTGESAAASPENFDEGIGQQIARRNARDKIWSLEGYLLRERLYHREEERRFEEMRQRNELNAGLAAGEEPGSS